MNQELRIKKNEKYPFVILHGWGKTGSAYDEAAKLFKNKGYKVFSFDLPGFGQEQLIKDPMTIDDYISFVLAFLKKNNLKRVIFIGHSFGGRIAAKLTAKHPGFVEKLILTGAPLIKQKLSFRKSALIFFARAVKKGIKKYSNNTRIKKVVYYLLGEWDYYRAKPEMKETFKEIIKEDISPNLQNISVPTLVVWGENDTLVSRVIGKQIAEKIPGAIYKEVPNATHKLPYEKPEEFAKIVMDFIE